MPSRIWQYLCGLTGQDKESKQPNKAQELSPTYTGSMGNSTGGFKARLLFPVAYLIASFDDGSTNCNYNRFA